MEGGDSPPLLAFRVRCEVSHRNQSALPTPAPLQQKKRNRSQIFVSQKNRNFEFLRTPEKPGNTLGISENSRKYGIKAGDQRESS
jgi:hypothetical protein